MRTLVSGSSPNRTSRNTACVFAQVASIALSATTSAPQHDLARTLLEVLWRSPNRVHQIAARGGISNKFRNIPVTGVGDAVSRALGLSAAGADAYFAPAEFQTPDNRTAANASGAYAFWMDVDCGESKAAAGSGYRTTADARSALAQFCRDTGLPEPTHIVDSGGGLHVYWILSEFVPREQWQSYARKFKRLAEACGFRADGCRTADIASVLRVPGTLNFKYDPPRPVTLTHASAELISTAAMLEAIDAAHCRLCGTAEPASPVHRDDVTLTAVDDTAAGSASHSSFVARLESALATLDPDCEEPEWAMRRLAPLAEAAREHPELDDELYSLARAWSSGELHGSPSEKWRHPGANGRTGEEALDEKWHRFLRSNYRGIPATVGTIFSDATKAGWVDPEDRFEVIDGDVEECA